MKKLKSLKSDLLRGFSSFRAPQSLTAEIIQKYLKALESPLASQAADLFQSGRHVELLELDVNPSDYSSAESFHRDYLAVNFLAKYKKLTLPFNPRERALAKFSEYENLCSETNSRFRNHTVLEKGPYADWLFSLRRKIDSILGEFDPEEFLALSSWGPGVSTLIKGSDTGPSNKFQNDIGITREAFELLGPFLGQEFPHWFREERVSDSSVLVTKGNKITVVPKNAKIDRVIAIEPGLNLYFQKGVGTMIRKRMKNVGVDLNDQSVNQKLARKGSIDDSLATVDFSSASDSIAKEVVRFCLPLEWKLVMNSLRCQVGSMEGREILWEKFSSMGNGFTWELESLIFYAAALVTCEKLGLDSVGTSVYGDDVIINSQAFHGFEKFCSFLGFRVNYEKSFFSGPFRESCGEHFFSGVPVKPLYLKDELSDLSSVYKLANSIRRLAHSRNLNYGCDIRFHHCFSHLVKRVPSNLRIRIPEGFGDGGFLGCFDEASPTISRLTDGWEGYRALVFHHRAVEVVHDHLGLLNARLGEIVGAAYPYQDKCGRWSFTRPVEFGTLSSGNKSPLRRQTSISLTEIVVPSWFDLGPWC